MYKLYYVSMTTTQPNALTHTVLKEVVFDSPQKFIEVQSRPDFIGWYSWDNEGNVQYSKVHVTFPYVPKQEYVDVEKDV